MVDATYTSPTTSSTDRVRDLIGDIDPDAFILTDAEIAIEIAEASNLTLAAANCAYKCITRLGEYDKLAAQFQRRGDALWADSKRGRMSSATATVGKVKDVATYPGRLEQGDEQAIIWDIDA